MDSTTEISTFPYDVFISYRWVSPDQEWVQECLFPALTKAGLRVCLDVHDFVPGRTAILEMERASKESRHVLCIITTAYFEKGRMVSFEELSARQRDPGGINSILIPLLLWKTELPDRIRSLIPVDWTNPAHRDREWKKLLSVLNAPLNDAPLPNGMELFTEVESTPPDQAPHCRTAVRTWCSTNTQ